MQIFRCEQFCGDAVSQFPFQLWLLPTFWIINGCVELSCKEPTGLDPAAGSAATQSQSLCFKLSHEMKLPVRRKSSLILAPLTHLNIFGT